MAKLPKWAIKQAGGINKKAWRLFRAKRKTPTKRASSPKKKGSANMGRKGRSLVQAIYKLVPAIALAAPAVAHATTPNIPARWKINRIMRSYTGVGLDGKFAAHYLLEGWLPFLAASGVVLGIQKLRGLIRRI